MSFGEAVRSVFGNYAKFDGRASRSEYWWFQLFNLLVVLAVYAVAIAVAAAGRESLTILYLAMAAVGIYVIAAFIPSLAVTVRRLHDSDKSGWWLLIGLVPYIGVIVLFIFTLLPSTPGINQFGPPYGMPGDVRRVRYRALTPEETWARYTEDAQRAAANGYQPVTQQWKRDGLGDYLEAVYTNAQIGWPSPAQGWQAPGAGWQATAPGWQPTPPGSGPIGASNPGRQHPFDGPPPDGSVSV